MTNTCSQCIFSCRIPLEEPEELKILDPHECRYNPPNTPTIEEQFWGECPFIEGSRQPCSKFEWKGDHYGSGVEAFDIMGTNRDVPSGGVEPDFT